MEISQLQLWKLRRVSRWAEDFKVGIPCHAIVLGMLVDICINCTDGSPSLGLGLFCTGMPDIVPEKS